MFTRVIDKINPIYLGIYFLIFIFILFLNHFLLKHNKNSFNLKDYLIFLFSISLTIYVFEINQFLPIKGSIFFQGDTFADAVKLFMSYGHIFTVENMYDFKVPYEWIDANPYSEKLINTENGLVNMHLTPFYSLLNHFFAYLVLFIFKDIYLFVVFYAFIYCLMTKKSLKNNYFVLIYIISFPSVFMFQRGNFIAGISGLLIFRILSNFFNNKLDKIDYLFLIIVASLRPNYILFCFLLIEPKFIVKSLKTLTVFFSGFISFNIASYIILNFLYPSYNFANFLSGLNWYNLNHLAGGDGFDSSTYRTILTFFRITDQNQQRSLQLIVLMLFMLIFLYLLTLYFYAKIGKFDFSLSLFSVSILATSPIGEYHLIVFVIFLIYYFIYKKSNWNYYILPLTIVIIPKFHNPMFDDINYSLFLNNISISIIILTTIYIGTKNRIDS